MNPSANHSTPAIPAASVAVLDNGRVLVVRRMRMPYRHRWSLPGGVLRPNEAAEAGARRELAEETGLVAQDLHFVTVHEPKTRRRYAISVFYCTRYFGEARAGDDAAEVAWRKVTDLDGLPMTPGTAAIVLAAHYLSQNSA